MPRCVDGWWPVEDVAGVGTDGGGGSDGLGADADVHGAEGPQGADELLDRDAGGVLKMAGDRGGGEHDGEVGLDGLALVVKDRPGFRSDLVMRKEASTCQRSW
ncbi:hypothetical protein GCM10012320_11450 [Sinomonas cellulolyticus]|nr:hypothetical protein GCM10012320_11450 [Sinomonas sp. KCTC 49339]